MAALIFLFLKMVAALFRSKSRLEAENAALRHQLIVLQRKVRSRVHVAQYAGEQEGDCNHAGDHVLIQLGRESMDGMEYRQLRDSFGPWRSQRTPRRGFGTGTVDLALRILE
jgi:hypothetical protein